MTAPASPSGALTLVTAANQRYWRSLYQFLLSVERVGGAGRGLSPTRGPPLAHAARGCHGGRVFGDAAAYDAINQR